MYPGFPTRLENDVEAIFKKEVSKGKSEKVKVRVRVSVPHTGLCVPAARCVHRGRNHSSGARPGERRVDHKGAVGRGRTQEFQDAFQLTEHLEYNHLSSWSLASPALLSFSSGDC